MPLQLCEGSHCCVREVQRSRVMKRGRTSAVRLVVGPPFSVLVASGDLFRAGRVWTIVNTAFMCASDTIMSHVHFVKKKYSFPHGIHYLPDFKPRFLQPPSTNQNDLDAVLNGAFGESCPGRKDSTETPAVKRRTEEPELGTAALSTQQADRITCT